MNEIKLFDRVLKGHPEAVALMTLLARACQVMDDIVDEDKPIALEVKHGLFWDMLVELPGNPFYQRHFARLNTVIGQALTDWFTANRMEQVGPNPVAYVIRNNLVNVLQEMVLIVGGYAWLQEQALTLRHYVHGNESYDDYAGEF